MYYQICLDFQCNDTTCPPSHGSCKNITNTKIQQCECNIGYQGENCDNINECETGQHKCKNYGTCEDKPGSYDCNCDSTRFEGKHCNKPKYSEYCNVFTDIK